MSRGSMRPPPVCADCSAPEPTWASINRGVLICDECCSVHRSLGRHISQVKSLKKGQWCPSQHSMVYILASNGANNIWEHTMLDPAQNKHGRRKPGPRDPLHPNKADFIRSKYQFLSFVNKQKDSDASSLDDVSRELHSSVRTNNVETCLRLLSKGADPNYFHREKGNSPIHVAAQAGQNVQVELLCVYGADPGAKDANGRTPYDYAKVEGFPDLADRLVELQYELTDRLTFYICGRKPDHRTGQHFKIPELGDNNADLSELAKQAKKKLQLLADHLFEELAMDVYDEVDRRENDSIWLSTHDHTSVLSERLTVPHLPVNPELSTTRNQGRQKLARFNAREFATLVVDILHDARRRQVGFPSPVQTPKDPDKLGRGSQHLSMMSDDEPLYDSVASDEDYSSIDTQSIKSVREETRPDITAESVSDKRTEAPVSSEELLEVRRALAASEATIKHLVQAKMDLEKRVDCLMRENADLRVNSQDFSALVMNGYDATREPGTDSNHRGGEGEEDMPPRSPSLRSSGARPTSMIEMRDSSRQNMQGGQGSNAQMMSSASVTNISLSGSEQGKSKTLSVAGSTNVDEPDDPNTEGHYDIPKSHLSLDGANEGQVQEVLSSIRESSESEGQGSNSSLAACGDDPNMPTQDEVVKKTEKVTKKIQELLVSAQEGKHNSFESCSERIFTAVSEMASLFPDETGSERLQDARVVLVASARRLRDECKSWPPSLEQDANPDFRLKTQQVIQYAYDIAKAAKKLVTLFQ
ncbi:ARF GTPase-activating protein GIT2 isoform X3 [Aplysia californica]|uniref:ARF GTPase-activating protein GIT2 isoform X3 n=1 Tax=Aplysia californica TaxID=6500 RepID=A0ABM1A8K2_APLCA|nr:ARF GTPase-activating protein GIT2 isoform X3 [Aplysia californica]